MRIEIHEAMKKLLVLALLLGLAFGCNSNPEGFTIKGNLSGEVADGTAVYLTKTDEKNQFQTIDTTEVLAGAFSFKGIQESPELHYINVDYLKGNIPVIVENGSIDISAQKDSLQFAKIKGTLQNDLFSDFLEASRELAGKAQTMNRDMREAATIRDTAVMQSLREEYFELQEEAKNFEINFAKDHPNALISALIIAKAQIMKALPEDKIKEMYEVLAPEIKETSVGKKIQDNLENGAKTSVGSRAPNFSAPTPSGEELALNDVLGKATILDFWAAWCRPCRAENPNVVRIYDKYKEKGLSILGVSLDRRAEDWKKAIADDGLEWHHVSNVQYFDEIAKLYNVNAIPATFILDENGVIVAKDLRGSALEAKIAEMLQ